MPPPANWKERAPDKFWARVQRTENIDECWLWHRAIPNGRYPMINYNALRKTPMPAHRVAFTLHYGYEPGKGRHICHRCNNKLCCNPHHLYDGTPKTNHLDAVKAGTFKPLKTKKGEEVPNSKLTLEVVLMLRSLAPHLRRRHIRTLAGVLGVNPQYMMRVARDVKNRWAHV